MLTCVSEELTYTCRPIAYAHICSKSTSYGIFAYAYICVGIGAANVENELNIHMHVYVYMCVYSHAYLCAGVAVGSTLAACAKRRACALMRI